MKRWALLLLLFAPQAFASPYIVANRDTTANPPTVYNIALPAGQTWLPATVTPLTSGAYAFKLDVANAPAGTTSVKISGCYTDPTWGQICNVEQTFPLTRPSALSGIALIP